MIDAKAPIGTRVTVAIGAYIPFQATVIGHCREERSVRVRRDGHSRFTSQKVSIYFCWPLDESGRNCSLIKQPFNSQDSY